MQSEKIELSVSDNERNLKNTIGQSTDIVYRSFIIPAFENCDCLIVFINKMTDKKVIDEDVLKPLMSRFQLHQRNIIPKSTNRISILIESGVFISEVKETKSYIEACDAIFAGNTAVFVENCSSAIILSTSNPETRAVIEPSTESEIRGPRDGFVENINTNISLIRRRIRDHGLRFENIKIGDRTKTDIALAYIGSLVNDSILQELRTRLSRIKIDSILASDYIEEFIEDSPYSILPQIEHTERPDKASSAILEGRIVILVDNTPFSLIVPTIFWNFIQTSGDYYERYTVGTFLRWIRFLSLFLSFTLSSVYVLLSSFSQEMLPTTLALKISEGRQGVPFPAVIEALILELLLEIMKEAGLRLPKPIGQSVSIVGTYVIGQAAVNGGIVSPTLVIFITIAAICSYTIPSASMSNSIRLIRFPMLFATSIFGLLGYLGGIVFLFLHVLSLRSFGESFLSPVIPFDKGGIKDIFIRAPWWKMKQRPKFAHPKDSNKQTLDEVRSKPPSNG